MSQQQQQEQRIFANGLFVKTQPTSYGDIIKLSVKVEDFITFLKDNQTENGWVSIDLLKKKVIDDKNRTHTPVLNNWVPNGANSTGTLKQAPVVASSGDDSEDLPF
jgi:hypothetical protein